MPDTPYKQLHKELMENLKYNDICSLEGAIVIINSDAEDAEDAWFWFDELQIMPGGAKRRNTCVVGADNAWWMSYYTCDDPFYSNWHFHECPIRPTIQMCCKYNQDYIKRMI